MNATTRLTTRYISRDPEVFGAWFGGELVAIGNDSQSRQDVRHLAEVEMSRRDTYCPNCGREWNHYYGTTCPECGNTSTTRI